MPKKKGKGKWKKLTEEKTEVQTTSPPAAAQPQAGPSAAPPSQEPSKRVEAKEPTQRIKAAEPPLGFAVVSLPKAGAEAEPSVAAKPKFVQPKKSDVRESKPRVRVPPPGFKGADVPSDTTKPPAQTVRAPPVTEAPRPKPSQPTAGGDGKGAIPKAKAASEKSKELAKELEERLKISHAPALRTVHDTLFPAKQTGTGGRPIALIANYFAVDLPQGYVYHYDVDIYAARKKETDARPKQPTTRRYPAALCRQIIDRMVSQYRNVLRCYPAFDGNKNLYTREKLPLKEVPQKFTVNLVENNKEETFTVAVTPVEKEDGTNAVSLQPLHDLQSGFSIEIMEEASHAMEVILRHGPSLKSVPVGRSFYLKPRSMDEVPLGEGRSLWFGYYQSLRPGWKKFDNTTTFYVNIDKSSTTFYKAQPVLNHVSELLNWRGLPPRFQDSDIRYLTKQMKGIKVEVTHLTYRRKYSVQKITREAANQITFDDDGKKTNIADYFRKRYKPLKYPQYPCICVNTQRNICIPLEVCEIVDNQPCNKLLTRSQTAEIVKKSAIPPKARFAEIQRSVQTMKVYNSTILKEFDVDIDLKPLRLEGRVIHPPAIEYAKVEKITPRDGQWEIGRNGFTRGAIIKCWIIISYCPTPPRNALSNLAEDIRRTATKIGMQMDKVSDIVCIRERSADAMVSIGRDFKNLQLIVVILQKADVLYKHVKTVSETIMGVTTQCLTDENARKCGDPKFSKRFFLQLCQKINAKMGGANNYLPSDDKPRFFSKPCMIIGADVSHPAPSGKEKYSIAAVAGSMDGGPSQYMATVELQRINTEVRAREERILNLTVMVHRLLKEFYNRTRGHLPEKLIYYRDGVSEGQFGPVRDYEIYQLREACKMFDSSKGPYRPQMTFIIVQKRHHFRMIPEDSNDGIGRMGNVPPGTIVDTDVTHPSFFDWFLCSHLGIQGTSRPAHYSVVWDDSDFDANTLQKLSFYLCHTHSRCTKSVSIPPPVLYADLMAYRAKLYINSVTEGQSEGSSSSVSGESDAGIPADVEQAINLHERIKNTMFFV